MNDALLDTLAKSGPTAVVLGAGIFFLWKAYQRKDAEVSALMREVTKLSTAIHGALNSISRKLEGRGRKR
jgi:hypothetical protein